MVEAKRFCERLKCEGVDFYAGVPDSLLKDFCAYLKDSVPLERNIIAANEGNAVGLACGWHLATGGIAAVYMQNSGEGNAINPLLSLADPDVYSIPMMLIIGWRGQPGVHDEPQHVKQGKVTCSLLETMGVPYRVLSKDWEADIAIVAERMREELRPAALVLPKGFFDSYDTNVHSNNRALTREEALEAVISCLSSDDLVVSTTGKESRELFELRERHGEGHSNDFLTVGGMGHTSSIALGVALGSERNVWCLDGDGSMIMHMGALAVAGQLAPTNFNYVLNDNAAHESVGGQPTASSSIDVPALLKAFGFSPVFVAESTDDVCSGVKAMRDTGFGALVVRTRQGARSDLGRPTTSTIENKLAFMALTSS